MAGAPGIPAPQMQTAPQRTGVKPPKLDRAPKNPMKKFNWVKLPDRDLNQNPHAVWMKLQGAQSSLKVNYDSIEEQFSQKQAEPKAQDTGKPAKVTINFTLLLSFLNLPILVGFGSLAVGQQAQHGHQHRRQAVSAAH